MISFIVSLKMFDYIVSFLTFPAYEHFFIINVQTRHLIINIILKKKNNTFTPV